MADHLISQKKDGEACATKVMNARLNERSEQVTCDKIQFPIMCGLGLKDVKTLRHKES